MGTSSGLWKASFGEVGASLKALQDNGVTLEHLARLRSDKTYAREVAAFMKKGGAVPVGVYRVVLDYTQTLDQMIEAGKFDWKNPDITYAHFPVSQRPNGEYSIQFVHFGRDMESDEVIAELDKMGLRPAELPELLALGAKYPDLQRQFPIVALGSVWQHPGGYRYVACLYGGVSQRRLNLSWWGDRWNARCRFAALTK